MAVPFFVPGLRLPSTPTWATEAFRLRAEEHVAKIHGLYDGLHSVGGLQTDALLQRAAAPAWQDADGRMGKEERSSGNAGTPSHNKTDPYGLMGKSWKSMEIINIQMQLQGLKSTSKDIEGCGCW